MEPIWETNCWSPVKQFAAADLCRQEPGPTTREGQSELERRSRRRVVDFPPRSVVHVQRVVGAPKHVELVVVPEWIEFYSEVAGRTVLPCIVEVGDVNHIRSGNRWRGQVAQVVGYGSAGPARVLSPGAFRARLSPTPTAVDWSPRENAVRIRRADVARGGMPESDKLSIAVKVV